MELNKLHSKILGVFPTLQDHQFRTKESCRRPAAPVYLRTGRDLPFTSLAPTTFPACHCPQRPTPRQPVVAAQHTRSVGRRFLASQRGAQLGDHVLHTAKFPPCYCSWRLPLTQPTVSVYTALCWQSVSLPLKRVHI